MSDEAAFLEALKTNPADDTVRLVYADWLDERDQPDKAQYLRAVTDLARLPGGTPAFTDAATQLYTASVRTDESWRRAAGARFDVRLDWYDLNSKIAAIKIVRELTGCGLGEAKGLTESAPVVLFSWLPFEVALIRQLAFTRGWFGGPDSIRAVLRPTTLPETATGTGYDVILGGTNLPVQPDDEDLAGLVDLLERSVPDVLLLLTQLPATVATGLSPADVPNFVLRLKAICCYGHTLPTDAIRVVPRVPAPEACS
ncbi:ribosomal protein L7/L12 [Gemmata sp. JC717]|uniref:ribosomal protein L7/L12 n=1 Tax=Gemmata algarum TaxID=2975278 RepID=UPI0021BB543A|nr:ribosomal protein L7/L12 [Gemmata algarum]MDY3552537.1 ribosomal protein L7/L12 [Gemmata algarum]